MELQTILTKAKGLRKFVTVLANPKNQKILKAIEESEEITVTNLWIKLRTFKHMAEVSTQLYQLRQIGVVKTKRKGKQIYYSIADLEKMELL